MFFASDTGSGAAPEVMAALLRANEGYARSYGADPLTARSRELIREIFEAPEAEVHLVATGTAANALALGLLAPPWGAIFCHDHAHIQEDECGAPEFFTHGAKLVPVPGPHGRMAPGALRRALEIAAAGGVHGVQPGAVSITNVTEAGTLHSPAQIAALAAEARAFGLPVHLDGARFANAVAGGNASPADLSWRAGVDVLSLGGTKNGCLGVEAVVIFDPAEAGPGKSWEFELRRKRGGHLFSKHRFLAAQMAAWLEDGLWLRLAAQSNRAAAALAGGLARIDDVTLRHPVEANILFPEWRAGRHETLRAAGAQYHAHDPAPGTPTPDHGATREGARLVTSWCTSAEEIEAFLALFAA
ncbi:threonine aldolase family protein [Pseudogemmobacter sonorensis]|uniref:threonine aldolase family protein n=1 Tax=Pseudogemmobacter sonorensis TaxID=2989681 RepID=UPI0036A0C316